MSAPLKELRKAAQISMTDHLAIFDHYVALGRDVEFMAIKFGCDIPMVITILEGYGETICDASAGRLRGVSQLLIKEYIEHFYPGIASENSRNDWINIEAYLDIYHPSWRQQTAARGQAKKWKLQKGTGLY